MLNGVLSYCVVNGITSYYFCNLSAPTGCYNLMHMHTYTFYMFSLIFFQCIIPTQTEHSIFGISPVLIGSIVAVDECKYEAGQYSP